MSAGELELRNGGDCIREGSDILRADAKITRGCVFDLSPVADQEIDAPIQSIDAGFGGSNALRPSRRLLPRECSRHAMLGETVVMEHLVSFREGVSRRCPGDPGRSAIATIAALLTAKKQTTVYFSLPRL
jgi:hypothetical protein